MRTSKISTIESAERIATRVIFNVLVFSIVLSSFFLIWLSTKKSPVQSTGRNDALKTRIIFFHPDYTVGLGISPNLLKARGLVGLTLITAGGELHPAPKTAIYLYIYFTAKNVRCQILTNKKNLLTKQNKTRNWGYHPELKLSIFKILSLRSKRQKQKLSYILALRITELTPNIKKPAPAFLDMPQQAF